METDERIIAMDSILRPNGIAVVITLELVGTHLWETRASPGYGIETPRRFKSRAAALEHHGASVRRVYQALERGEE
jgi:hypothetical protein